MVPGVVDLAGLIPSWDETQVGPDVSRSANARGIVDHGHKGERGQLADADMRRMTRAAAARRRLMTIPGASPRTLPGVSGLEICHRLRARESMRTLPVIMGEGARRGS